MKKEKVYIYGRVNYDLGGLEEINQLIETEYKMSLKYRGGKVDPDLKAKYETLKYRTKKVENIRNIYFIKDAYFCRRASSRELYSFLVFDNGDNTCLVYNITTGEDHSFEFNKIIYLITGKTEIVQLYDYNDKDYQDTMNIGYMESITIYENAKLVNSYSNKLVKESCYIEFKDRLGNVFYVDYLSNRLFFKKDSYVLLGDEQSEKKVLFEFHKSGNVDVDVLKKDAFDVLYLKKRFKLFLKKGSF